MRRGLASSPRQSGGFKLDIRKNSFPDREMKPRAVLGSSWRCSENERMWPLVTGGI